MNDFLLKLMKRLWNLLGWYLAGLPEKGEWWINTPKGAKRIL